MLGFSGLLRVPGPINNPSELFMSNLLPLWIDFNFGSFWRGLSSPQPENEIPLNGPSISTALNIDETGFDVGLVNAV